MTYSRPMLRGRTDIFGKGADYGKKVSDGTPVWRAGANQTTKLKTEVPLMIGGKRIEPGSYDLFVDLKEAGWMLVVSTQPTQDKYDANDKTKIWGAYGLRAEVRRRPRADDDADAHGLDRSVDDRLRGHDRRGRQARDGLGHDRRRRSVHRREVGMRTPSPRSSLFPERGERHACLISSPPAGGRGQGEGGGSRRQLLFRGLRRPRSGPRHPVLGGRSAGRDPCRDRRRRGARDRPPARTFSQGPGLAGVRRRGRADEVEALAAGLSDAAIERFPADGRTKYAHFLSHVGWDPVSATLEEVSPQKRLIASCPDLPVALADYSQDANVTAALVDVGAGTKAADYEDKDVRGKIVLADGSLPIVHRLACEERGAAGFLSAYPNQHTPWSGDDRDLIRWGHLSPYQSANRFAFMVSKRQAEDLRSRLSSGEKVVLRASVRAKMVPATYDVVVATIPGTDPAAGEIVMTAHLCHESAGANDNASGSAAILEVARALNSAIRKGSLPRPRRTIRFLWLPEITGSQAYLVRHPEIVQRIHAGVHMDMVGGLPETTRGTFHLSRTAESLPHAANAIAQAWFDQVVRASSRYAEGRGDADSGFVWPPGARGAFLGDVRKIDMGSDHEVFEAAASASRWSTFTTTPT